MNKMNWLQSNYICTHTYISYGEFTGGARIIAREQIKDIRIEVAEEMAPAASAARYVHAKQLVPSLLQQNSKVLPTSN